MADLSALSCFDGREGTGYPDGRWHFEHSSVEPMLWRKNFGFFGRGRDEAG